MSLGRKVLLVIVLALALFAGAALGPAHTPTVVKSVGLSDGGTIRSAKAVVAVDPGGYGYYGWPTSYPSCGMFDLARFGKTYAVFSMVTYRPEERICRWFGWQSGSRTAYGHPPGWHDDGYWG